MALEDFVPFLLNASTNSEEEKNKKNREIQTWGRGQVIELI